MITADQINFVEKSTWYQTIELEKGVKTKGYEWCGDPAWRNISRMLPKDLTGCRILDLGCNAGLFCVRAALAGAKEVIGVDWPGWRPGQNFQEQQVFIRNYFENKYGRKLPITYYADEMENFLKRKDLGQFDYVLGIASLYYVNDRRAVVRAIADIADNVIARLREDEVISQFENLFKCCGYVKVDTIWERWWEELGMETDDFYLFHFRKDKLLEIFYYRLEKGHRELSGAEDLLDIWQLMEIVGTEIPIDKFQPRIPEEFITRVRMDQFACLKKKDDPFRRFNPNEDELNHYPWKKLIKSITDRGFLTPIIVERIYEEGEFRYNVLEGHHRLSAASLINSFGPESLIPCVVVERRGQRV